MAGASEPGLGHPALVPAPRSVQPLEHRFVLEPSSCIYCGTAPDAAAAAPTSEFLRTAEVCAQQLRAATGFELPVVQDEGRAAAIRLILVGSPCEEGTGDAGGAEGYKLHVAPEGVVVRAGAPPGIYYGFQTLRQLLPAAAFGSGRDSAAAWSAMCVVVTDRPQFRWRGAMLDVARHFMPVDFVKRFIDWLSQHKMNRFHWHLTDDQGWRVEIKRYPKLTSVGAWRKETQVGHASNPQVAFDGNPHGGFYTQEEIRDVVAYAGDRHVTVVPEIEMPGHSQAALASYPELGNSDVRQPLGVHTMWGVNPNVLNVVDSTIEFMQGVLEEVLELFPSEFIHIGGDECVKTQWEHDARAQQRIRDEGLKNEQELQSWFIRQMDCFLASRGRRLIGWDEILEGGLAKGATVMSWRGTEGGVQAARLGHDVVMAPTVFTYLDYYQREPTAEEPLAIGGFLPLQKVYSFDPVPPGFSPEERSRVLGVQAQLWTEYMAGPEKVEYMAFPRLSALAEVAWTGAHARPFEDFLRRLRGGHLDRLSAQGVRFCQIRDAGVDASGAPRETSLSTVLTITTGFGGTSGTYVRTGRHQNGRDIYQGPGDAELRYEVPSSGDGNNWAADNWICSDCWTLSSGGHHRYAIPAAGCRVEELSGFSGWQMRMGATAPVIVACVGEDSDLAADLAAAIELSLGPNQPAVSPASAFYYVAWHLDWGHVEGETFGDLQSAEDFYQQKAGGPHAVMLTNDVYRELRYYGGREERLADFHAWWTRQVAARTSPPIAEARSQEPARKAPQTSALHTVPPVGAAESWWAGVVQDGLKMPLGPGEWSVDFSDSRCNQVNPVLVSTRGRYIWCDSPCLINCKSDGTVSIQACDGPVVLGGSSDGKGSLRSAFKEASQSHFRPSGKLPHRFLFSRPQYNLWIDCLYDPTQAKVLDYARGVVKSGLEPGVIMIDDNWSDFYGSFEFNARGFPNPTKMLDELHSMGFKVMVWVSPFVSPDSTVYRELARQKLLVKSGTKGAVALVEWWNGFSAVLDFLNPAAVEWFRAKLDNLCGLGVDGFKFDGGDPAFYPSHGHEHCSAFANVGLKYDMAEYRACWKNAGMHLVQRLCDKSHAWDASGLASLVPNGLAQGLAGYAFTCPDMIGGGNYADFVVEGTLEPRPDFELDQELFVRMAQVSALFPMMQFSLAPWKVLDAEHLQHCVVAGQLRERFAPYISELANHASRTGEPIIRHMEYVFPHAGFEHVTDQFMLGDDVLVAPILQKGAKTRAVQLPEGCWFAHGGAVLSSDGFSDESTDVMRKKSGAIHGPTTVRLSARHPQTGALSELALFARRGFWVRLTCP